jgi:enamine deaminase RidA (YjgF/YER057c/UK114 family)
MSKLEYFSYPGWGDMAKEKYHYAQAVRIGNEIKISGQGMFSLTGHWVITFMHYLGGWNAEGKIPDSEEEQIVLAFENIDKALKHAGIEKPFENIYSIRSYHVGLHDKLPDLMVNHLKKLITTHQPIWTLIGVERLALKEMKVEIEVGAVVDGYSGR